ncbi:MAG: hypothetical protein NWF03_00395 [Candidatus Bathyarchaeota archaeon]|nr:hypothetical protein [Candidatus Bathyarchaeota archaeon]
MSEFAPIPEKLSERKIIVYKSRVDPTIVKLTAEKMKYKLFSKLTFSKNRSEEIRVVSVDKYYEPYVLIDAKYHVKYFRKRVYVLDVDDETEDVEILGNSFAPETDAAPSSSVADDARRIVRLEAQMWSSYSDKVYLVLNRDGEEIPPDQVPAAPSEDHPEKILAEFKKDGVVELSPQKEIELVKSKVIKRPSESAHIDDELFLVSEHAVIYSPVYEITFRNVKTGEERLVKIDGVTAKIVS